MTSKVNDEGCPENGQASAAACRPWCADHTAASDACSTAYVEVDGVVGMSVWASQLPTDSAPLIAVDGYDGSGVAFDLALTPAQALSVGALLQGLALFGGVR